jgi:hypothetical protein
MFLGLIVACAVVWPASAADWYVAAQGDADNDGSKECPWDIESALAGKQKIAAGDTLWLKGGTYQVPFHNGGGGYEIKLVGRANAPIHVRPHRGERVTIDGGLFVQPPSAHLWIRDLEIIVSQPLPEKVLDTSSHPNLNRPWGGLNMKGGVDCKYINMVMHHNCQGVSFWAEATGGELHGCLIYDNGWIAPNRGHGHAVYTQNKDGTKIISDCIMTGGCGFSMHGFGSKNAYVDNFVTEGNIVYNANTYLIGGGRPSQHICVRNNYLYNVGTMELGTGPKLNEDLLVRDNLIVNGELKIGNWKPIVNERNLVLTKGAERPKGAKIVLRPNKYDPARANVAIFNWEEKESVEVDVAGFLKPGDHYRFMDPKDFFGKPLLSGTCDGKLIKVPMTGEFAAFVLLKDNVPQ